MAARVTCSCGWTKTYPSQGKAEFNARRHVCTAGQKSKARRANRHRRCARCGLDVTYDDATVAEANHWFSKHSCRKREDAMVRAATRKGREALIDRTPKPCLHKVATHQHGERATYVLDKCRCLPCSKANSEAENERTRLKAYGRYHKYVSAEFVRDHLRELGEYGIGLKRVAKLSGVSTGTLSKIMFGVYAAPEGEFRGCNGKGERVREPSRRVLRTTAEKIYAVEAVPANLGAGQADHERTSAARLHLQALVALGWSQSKLAVRLGMLPTNLGPVIGTSTAGGPNRPAGLRVLSRSTVDKIEALYDELSMRLPPETNQRERISVSRSKRYAKAHGWLPPLAIEDVTDTEAEGPDVDEVAIQRRMNGDKSVRLTQAEGQELRRRWYAAGRSGADLERVCGMAPYNPKSRPGGVVSADPWFSGHRPTHHPAISAVSFLEDLHAPEWMANGLCAQTDPESFFPEKGERVTDAKRICMACEVRTECLEYALSDERTSYVNPFTFGIWGGLTARECRALIRARQAGGDQ